MTYIKSLLIGSNSNIERSSYLWNMFAGVINAGQSVLILIVLGRTGSIEDAGVFAIAWAIANLVVIAGKYGVRNYQVTDIEQKYSFKEYAWTRVVTCMIMAVLIGYYLVKGIFFLGWSNSKTMIVGLMCLWKMIDAIEDVFYGDYQQKGRLDVGAKATAVRMGISLLVLLVVLIANGSLLNALIAAIVSSGILMVVFVHVTISEFESPFHLENAVSWANVKVLLVQCFPIFVAGYIGMYLGNAGKYAIDAYLDEAAQACYNYVFMPVFVIPLFSSFLYQPILVSIASDWNDGKIPAFQMKIKKQSLRILLLTVLCMAGGYVLGVPVLSWLYGTDLSEYRNVLVILLFGGGMMAMQSFLGVVLVTMRQQRWMMMINGIGAVILGMVSNTAVRHNGVLGVAVVYAIVMLSFNIAYGYLYYRFGKNSST